MRAWFFLLVSLLVPATSHAQAAPVAPEPLVKAQFFERFTRFVDWPAASQDKGAPFVICLAGSNAVASEIERLAARLPMKGRPARVRRLGNGAELDPRGCHAVYIAPSVAPLLERLLSGARGRPILTVADSPGFGARGVIINMFTDNGYIRFEINDPVARASGLRLSSQLLRLARTVE